MSANAKSNLAIAVLCPKPATDVIQSILVVVRILTSFGTKKVFDMPFFWNISASDG